MNKIPTIHFADPPHLIQNEPVPNITLVVDILETLSNVVIIFPTHSSV